MSRFSALEIAVDKPQRMMLLDPQTRQPLVDRDGITAFIDVYSADSEAARRHQRKIQQQRLQASRGARSLRLSPEQLEAEALDLLAGLTAGWHLVGRDGNAIDVPFSPDAARELYAAPALAWVREQVDDFAADRGNFTQASSQS